MKRLVLVACLVAGCTASPSASLPATPPARPTAPATLSPAPTPSTASAPPVVRTTFTKDDEALAVLIRDGAATAIPQLKLLMDLAPQKQVPLFEPLGVWIGKQRASIKALTPSTCTEEAVAIYLDAISQFDHMRKKFLAWKDWGAHGNAYAPGAPRVAIETIQDALAELDATCPG